MINEQFDAYCFIFLCFGYIRNYSVRMYILCVTWKEPHVLRVPLGKPFAAVHTARSSFSCRGRKNPSHWVATSCDPVANSRAKRSFLLSFPILPSFLRLVITQRRKTTIGRTGTARREPFTDRT